jgi:hypothetical protein
VDLQRAKVTAALEPLVVDGDVHRNLDPEIMLRTYLLWANKDNVPRMVQNPAMPNWSNQKTARK